MILRTNGIEYDDRIRKEMLTIMKLYPDISFKIFVIFNDKQQESGDFKSDYGVEYHVPLLKSRLKYKQNTHILQKAWDFYKTVNPMLKDFDAIWCADIDPIFFIALSKKPKVWDLHEIPGLFLRNGLTKVVLKFLMSRCNIVIHANPQRIDFLEQIHALANKKNQFVIRNYPSFNDAYEQLDELLMKFKTWLGESNCVYLQGATGWGRCDIESVQGILNIKNIKTVVIGQYDNEVKKKLAQMYGKEFEERVFFTGLIPQQMTPHYIKCCKVSLVLYRENCANNKYCEPNRMFQSIINDCPVVVGCNPTMKGIVDKYNVGISLETDGSKIEDITNGLNKVISQYDYYIGNIKKCKSELLWNSQEKEFQMIIDSLLG